MRIWPIMWDQITSQKNQTKGSRQVAENKGWNSDQKEVFDERDLLHTGLADSI
jgi:hypothetical protein